MTETKQALDAVVALVEKATPGEWKFRGGDVGRSEVSVGNASEHWNREVICDDTFYYPTGVSHENMRAIAAAVSFIRTHGPALQSALEQVEQLQAALGEAREDVCVALVADIRFACGDNRKRMQPELVEFIRELAADAAKWRTRRKEAGRE